MRKYLVFCFLSLVSCGTKSNLVHEVKVIKFMGTITTQSRSIDEKAFWYFKDEHATLKIRNNGFIEHVKELKDNKIFDFEEYVYAFIVKKGNSIDTLYSDRKLKSWILKRNNQEVYFYDKEGIIADNLKNTYSFFYECW